MVGVAKLWILSSELTISNEFWDLTHVVIVPSVLEGIQTLQIMKKKNHTEKKPYI